MMPLCTSAMSAADETCGWAFGSVGAPCVAHRVCAMPQLPEGGPSNMAASSAAILPARLTTRSRPAWSTTATPAES